MDSRTKQMTRAMALDSAVRRVAASSRFYEVHEILELAETFVGYIENGVDYDEGPEETVSECTRPAPHVCRVNGPCNGLPKGIIDAQSAGKSEEAL